MASVARSRAKDWVSHALTRSMRVASDSPP
jgi:hypothetical protein